MVMTSYTDIRDQIGKDLADLASADAQARLIDQLAELRFEIDRVKAQQRMLLTALRARDIIVREQSIGGGPPRVIALDPRDNLDMTEGFHKLDWDADIAVRWTGPGHDTLIRIWLDRTIPVIFELGLLSYGDARNRGAVTLTVDGLPVSFEQVDETLLRSAPLPLLDQSLYTEILVHVPFLTGGAENAAETGEVRGICVSHIRFFSGT